MQTNPQLFQQAFAGMVFESAILRQGHESQAKQMTHHCTWLLSCIALWGLMIVMSLFGQDSRQSRHPVNWNPFRTILLQQRETWTIIDIRHWSDAWERDTVLNCSGWRYSIQINATWLPCHILKFWGFGFLSISIATINDFWISSPGTCCRRAFSGDPWCLAVGNSALCWESWKCNWWLCIWYVIHAYIYIYIHIYILYLIYYRHYIHITYIYIYIYIAADPRQALGSKFEPEIWGPGIASHGFFLDRVKAGIQIHTALNKNKQHIIANYWAFNTMLFIYIYTPRFVFFALWKSLASLHKSLPIFEMRCSVGCLSLGHVQDRRWIKEQPPRAVSPAHNGSQRSKVKPVCQYRFGRNNKLSRPVPQIILSRESSKVFFTQWAKFWHV